MTTAQIVQFVTGLIYVSINMKRKLLDGEPCTSNHWTGVFSTAVNCSFIVMFSMFFSKNYAKRAATPVPVMGGARPDTPAWNEDPKKK